MGTVFAPKRTGRKADSLPPASDEVKKEWNYTSLPHVFMAWCLVTHREQFYLTFCADTWKWLRNAYLVIVAWEARLCGFVSTVPAVSSKEFLALPSEGIDASV